MELFDAYDSVRSVILKISRDFKNEYGGDNKNSSDPVQKSEINQQFGFNTSSQFDVLELRLSNVE